MVTTTLATVQSEASQTVPVLLLVTCQNVYSRPLASGAGELLWPGEYAARENSRWIAR
jgi:hypothetical protein